MSVCYRCRAVGAVGGLSQMSGAGHSPVGGGGGSVPVCVCALFMGHIGYISLKTKNIIFLSLFSFIIKVFAKTRNYKKKPQSVSAVHSEAETPDFCFSASCRLLTLSGLVSPSHAWEKLYPGGSLWTSKPEGCASQYTRIYMNI